MHEHSMKKTHEEILISNIQVNRYFTTFFFDLTSKPVLPAFLKNN